MMALYLVATAAGGRLVRARNGRRALDLVADATEVERVHESGPEGVVGFGGMQDDAAAPEMHQDGRREIDVTNLSDRPGTRRFRNVDTGEVRTETVPKD